MSKYEEDTLELRDRVKAMPLKWIARIIHDEYATRIGFYAEGLGNSYYITRDEDGFWTTDTEYLQVGWDESNGQRIHTHLWQAIEQCQNHYSEIVLGFVSVDDWGENEALATRIMTKKPSELTK